MSAAQEDEIRRLNSKVAKQRNEIGRLAREVEQLAADKAALRFDLHKARVAADQMRASEAARGPASSGTRDAAHGAKSGPLRIDCDDAPVTVSYGGEA